MSSSTLCSLLCWLVLCSVSYCGPYARAKSFNVGTYDSQGQLHNNTEGSFKFSVSSFFAYFVDDQDLNLGLSLSKPRNPKKPKSYTLSLDIAPHHAGGGITWHPSTKGKLRMLAAAGAGAGFNYTYNTVTKKLEFGLKGTLIRW